MNSSDAEILAMARRQDQVVVTTRLEQAGLEELEAWSERVLDAGTLEEVFP